MYTEMFTLHPWQFGWLFHCSFEIILTKCSLIEEFIYKEKDKRIHDDYSTLVAVAPERKRVERRVRVQTSWNTLCFSPVSKWVRIISDMAKKFPLFGLFTALIMKNRNNDTKFRLPKFCHQNYQSCMKYINTRQTGKIKLIKE